MKESFSSPELKREITKDDVIAVYKKFVERGIKNPDNLDFTDPEVKEAEDLLLAWCEQEDQSANGDDELQLRANLAKTMFYIDASFDDPDYLDEILHDWLIQDSQNAEKQLDNPERIETRRQIAQAMNKIRSMLKSQK